MVNKSLYTSNSKLIRLIIKKVILFAIPFVIILLFPFFILLFSGELFGIYKQTDKSMFGLSYSYPVKYLKMSKSIELNPDLLVLGSSRAMQFEESLFTDSYSFYNAGGAINVLENFNLYYGRLNVKPKKLIITIDPWWFNYYYDNLHKNYYPMDFDRPGNPIRIFKNQWKTVYDDLIHGKISIKEIINNKEKVGLLAIMKNEGFLQDGSYQYSQEKLEKSDLERMRTYINDAQKNQDRFLNCTEINSEALDKFENFVFTAKEEIGEKNVFLIYPPIAKVVLQELEPTKHVNYFYLNDSIQNRMAKIKMSNQYFYSKKTQNKDMIDGIHPTVNTIEIDLKSFAKENDSLKELLNKNLKF